MGRAVYFSLASYVIPRATAVEHRTARRRPGHSESLTDMYDALGDVPETVDRPKLLTDVVWIARERRSARGSGSWAARLARSTALGTDAAAWAEGLWCSALDSVVTTG